MLSLLIRSFDKAIEDYTKAIKINPNYAKAYFNRGRVYRVYRWKENQAKAAADYAKAKQLGFEP